MRIASAGHVAFAVVMIGLGILGLIKGDFTVAWEPIPKTIPAREVLAYLCAVISLASGIGLLWRRTATIAARVLLVFLVLWLLVWRIPGLFQLSLVEGTWSCGKHMIMVAAAWVLFAWFTTGFGSYHCGVDCRRLVGGRLIPRHPVARRTHRFVKTAYGGLAQKLTRSLFSVQPLCPRCLCGELLR